MINKASILLYWHTIKFLKLIQIYARLRLYLFGRILPQKYILSPHPNLRARHFSWSSPIAKQISMLDSRSFRFLNLEYKLSPRDGWNEPALEKLWLYNLHYFDDLNAINARARLDWHQALVLDWLESNPPAIGNGWEPYPTSLRIVNWIKWSLCSSMDNRFKLPPGFIQSLAVQADWLKKNLEFHLLGNHIFANAKALVFSGCYFRGGDAERWLECGLKIIKIEIDEQILGDGGNFERSPMYHAIFLEDILDLINLANEYPNSIDLNLVKHWQSVAKKMLLWLRDMIHPDGEIGFFNDAAFGVASTFDKLQKYAIHLGISVEQKNNLTVNIQQPFDLICLKDSGYIRVSTGKAVAILDVAPLGPNYLPGHGHADTLSFELSIFGQRLIVNGGTSRYGDGSRRLSERQTCSHSTVELNGESSSEVWGGFRVARRANPFDLEIVEDVNQLAISCSHDGYKRLPGKPTHRRTWVVTHNSIEIKDVVFGQYNKAVAKFIFHPTILVTEVKSGFYHLTLPNKIIITLMVKEGSGRIMAGSYAPEFNKTIETQCICVSLVNATSCIEIGWT